LVAGIHTLALAIGSGGFFGHATRPVKIHIRIRKLAVELVHPFGVIAGDVACEFMRELPDRPPSQ
jgi:hypothetical protein